MLDWTLQLINHVWVPWAVAGLLLVWGGGHWVALQSNFFRPLHQQLVEMRRQLEETPDDPIAFSGRYPDVGESLARLNLVAPAWLAFSKTLTLSPVRGVPLHGSREPSHFFNADALMGREAAHYYYRTIPNVLLSIGILVTLIGLVVAIHFAIQGMDSGDLYATQSALMGLLNAASVKFLASIMGLLIALLFSWEERRHKHHLERDAEQICQLLQERMAWTTDDQVGRDQLHATQAQSRHLQEISDRLQQVIAQPTFQANVGKSSADPLLTKGVVEQLARQFETSMGQLRETVLALGESIKTLPVSVVPLGQAISDGSGVQSEVLEQLAAQLGAQVAAFASHSDAHSTAQTALLERLTVQMEQTVTAVVAKAGSGGLSVEDLTLLLDRMQQDGERLLQANEVAMGRVLAAVGQQVAGMQTDTTLATLHVDERTQVVDTVVARMERAMAHMGDASLSPFYRIAGQLEQAIELLNDRVGAPTDMAPLVEALRAEGVRLQATHAEIMERFQAEWARHPNQPVMQTVSADGMPIMLEQMGLQMEQAIAALGDKIADSVAFGGIGSRGASADGLPVLLEQMGLQIENAIVALGEKIEGVSGHAGMDRLVHAVRQEGAQLVRSNEASMQAMLDLVNHRITEATASATLSELQPAEREGLLERVALRMEQAVASLGEVGLAPFFDTIRREMEQIPGVGQHSLNDSLKGSFARITQQLDSVTAALESKVWAADTAPDMTQLVKAIRGEGERLLKANEHSIDRLFAELTQRSPSGAVAGADQTAILNRIAEQMAALHHALTEKSAWTDKAVVSSSLLPDLDTLFTRIQREGERLVQANESAMAGLLSEVARRFAGVSATTALAELRPAERSELLDGVALRMERAVASLGELGLTPFFDGMRYEIGRLIQTNQQAVTELVNEISRRTRERGTQETHLLESVVTQVGHAITQMGEKFAAAVPQTASLVSDELSSAIRMEGERLQESHQRLLGQLERVLGQLAGVQAAVPAAPVAMGEVVAVLDEQSIQPLLEGWRQEGERLVMASEAAFERLLEEVGQQFAQLRSGEGVALLEQLSTQLQHSIQVVHEPTEVDAEEAEGAALQAGAALMESHESLRPVLMEMTRIISQQRRDERRLLKQVVNEVNRSVAALDAKIGRATPLNMSTLVNTVHAQGERLFASVNTLAPMLAEISQVISQQRGEEMRLLERVATEVNRSVDALDAKIGRATPLQLKRLVETVQDGTQDIVRALQSRQSVVQPTSASVVQPTSGSVVQAAAVAAPVTGVVQQGGAGRSVVADRLPVGTAGMHALLEGLSQGSTSSDVVMPSASMDVAIPALLAQEALLVEPGLLLAYESVFTSDGVVRANSSPWVAAKIEGGDSLSVVQEVAVQEPFARLLSAKERSRSIVRPRVESKLPLVMVAAEQGVRMGQEVRAGSGDLSLRPLVPALLQEFGIKKNRSWQPFTVFVENQTADCFDSQERFSLFKV